MQYVINKKSIVFFFNLGKSSELRHYRNDQLVRVIKDRNYDDMWQPYRNIRVPINFRGTDKLVGFCDFSPISENKSYTVRNKLEISISKIMAIFK